jgi:inhibitor of KinA
MDLLRYGEDGIRIVFGKGVDPELHEKVRRYYYFLKYLCLDNVFDIIPSFTSCLIYFDSRRTSFEYLTAILAEREGEAGNVPVPEPAQHKIPVMYGGEYGPDMEFICSYSGLTEEEVIEIHTGRVYTVFAVGFMPGFPYLGPLDNRLYVPRLETPRVKVPEGSVGLAHLQTGIYSFESPAGWRILGKTDVNLFDYKREPYGLLAMGDKVRFIRI